MANKELSKQLKLAKSWCEGARDILKIKRSGPRLDKKTFDSKQLDLYMGLVQKGLDKLKKAKSKEYEPLAEETVKRAETGRIAVEEGNQELARVLIDHLIVLDMKIKVALGEAPPERLDQARESVAKREQAVYDKALLEAERYKAELEKLTAANHRFTGEIPTLIEKAKTHYKSGPQAMPFALLNLGNVPAEYELQQERRRQFVKYNEKLGPALDSEKELKILDKLNGRVGHAKPVTDVIDAAQALCNEEFKYDLAIAKIGEVDKAYESVVKGLPKDQKSNIAAIAKARKSFDDKYFDERDRINQAKTLRGMEEKPAKDHIDLAEKTLDTARLNAERATTAEAVKDAEKSLATIEKEVDKAVEASSKAKEGSTKSLEAMSKWMKLLPVAEKAYEGIKLLRGTDVEQNELFLLLGSAKTKLKKVDGVMVGYPEALAELEGYTDIVDRARKTNKTLLERELPKAAADAATKVYEAIHALSGYAPLFMVDIQLEEMRKLSGNIRNALHEAQGDSAKLKKAEEDSVADIQKFAKEINDERDRLTAAKKTADDAREAYLAEAKRLRELGMPTGMLAESERLAKTAFDVDMHDREWARASTKLATALGLVKEIDVYYQKHSVAWADKQKKLTEYKTLAREMQNWPPVMSSARGLLDDCNALESRFNTTFDFQFCLDEFASLNLEKRHQNLLDAAKTAPRGDVLMEVRKTLNEANAEFNEKSYQLRTEKLRAMEKLLTGIGEPTVTPLHAAVKKAEDEWFAYYLAPDDNVRSVKGMHEAAINGLKVIEGKIDKIIAEPKLLAGLQQKIKQEERSRHESDLPGHIAKLIDRLEAAGHDVKKHRRDLVVIGEKGGVQKTQLYEKFQDDLLKLLDEEKKKTEAKFERASLLAADVGDTLKDLKHRHKNFQPYQELLESQMNDVKSMIASGDLEMLELANKMLSEISNKVSEVDPDQRNEDSVRYAAVENEWAQLSRILGATDTTGGAIVIENRMPNTYQRLRGELDEAIMKAKKSSPKEGLAILKKLGPSIVSAAQQARKLNDEHEVYKERKRQLEDRWSEVKKKTHTQVTDRTKAVEAWFEARLLEAEGLRHTEKGLPAATKILVEMEDLVRDVLEAPEPRERLQELDVKYAKQERAVRDMARQFNVELKNFKEVVVESTREAIKANHKAGKISEIDMKDSLQMVDGLTKVADSASKVVKPYLANLETLPHKKAGRNEAPRLDKANGDFDRAREMLVEGRRTAERLAGQTTTTNVNISNDLNEVQKNWSSQVKGFSAAIRTTTDAVTKGVAELERTAALPPNELTALKQNADEAVKLLKEVEGHFSMAAFSRPFSVLTDSGDPAAEKKKLAAREDALRIMRQYRTDVLNHPVLTKLTDKRNPFKRARLVAATGYLRAALKRIEIETLIGV